MIRKIPVDSIIYLALIILPFVPLRSAFPQDTKVPIPSPKSHLSELELKIWKDPSFKKNFTESYIAETDIEPRVTVPEREQMQEILELISADKMDEAIEKLKEFRTEAASAVFDFTLANIYFQQGKLEEAAPLYQAAVEKYPKFRRAWKNLGIIYFRQGALEKALPALVKVVELGGNDALTYGSLGIAHLSVENYLSAESAFRLAILLDPTTLEWEIGLAKCFLKQESYADAVALFGQLIQRQPDKADLWLFQANAYIALNKPLKAAEIYELVDHLGKSTAASLYQLGDIYVNEELYELAVNSYIRALSKKEQNNSDRLIRAAKALVARGALEETKNLIEQIVNHYGEQLKDEDRKDILKLRARIVVAEGSGDEEVPLLKEIVTLDPLDGEALILLGQYYNRVGNAEQAVFYYERAEAIEKYEADAKVRHAQLLVGQGKYDEALPLLRRAQQIKPRENIQKYLEQVERAAKTR